MEIESRAASVVAPKIYDLCTARSRLGLTSKLYEVQRESRKIIVQGINVDSYEPSKNIFYIVDREKGRELYVWSGNPAIKPGSERFNQLERTAEEYAAKRGYAVDTKILPCHVEDPEITTVLDRCRVKKSFVERIKEEAEINPAHLAYTTNEHHSVSLAAMHRMPDDGSGQMVMWEMRDGKLCAMSKKNELSTGSAYVALYSYTKAASSYFIVYAWYGDSVDAGDRLSVQNAIKTVDMHVHHQAVIVEMEQGHEVKHFLQLFKGKLTVLRADRDENMHVQMFQVSGISTHTTKAIEVEPNASLLDSRDCFIVKADEACYVWSGRASNGDEREMAKRIANDINAPNSAVVLAEGREQEAFWTTLGGRSQYNQIISVKQDPRGHVEPKLYKCSEAVDRFVVKRIAEFSQGRLSTSDVMILDAIECVFIWIGESASQTEMTESHKIARKYLKTAKDHNPNRAIVTVKQGFEPVHFTGWFPDWSDSFWRDDNDRKNVDFDGVVASVAGINVEAGRGQVITATVKTQLSYNDLVGGKGENIDSGKREQYLADREFENIFGMSKAEFNRQRIWKQKQMKEVHGLF